MGTKLHTFCGHLPNLFPGERLHRCWSRFNGLAQHMEEFVSFGHIDVLQLFNEVFRLKEDGPLAENFRKC